MEKNTDTRSMRNIYITIISGFALILTAIFVTFPMKKFLTIHEILSMLLEVPVLIWTVGATSFFFYIVYIKLTKIHSYLNGDGNILQAQKAIIFLPKFIPVSICICVFVASFLASLKMELQLAMLFVTAISAAALLVNTMVFLKVTIHIEDWTKNIPLSKRYPTIGLNRRLFISVILVGVSFALGITSVDVMEFYNGGYYMEIYVNNMILIPLFSGITVYIVILLQKLITNPVKKLSTAMEEISKGEGDLTKRLEVNTRDEIGELVYWFNTFVNNIAEMISGIRTSLETLGNSSSEIEQSSIAQSKALSGQEESVHEMSTNMQEIAVYSDKMARLQG
ncbi:MAG: methyl-accepting chemotaxis protein, partial [Thermodesulfobacteriota bacterium]|nr:methyl-accepting chemotaxis protein [Thermodesulfobacteriota bacterium]